MINSSTIMIKEQNRVLSIEIQKTVILNESKLNNFKLKCQKIYKRM